MRVGVQVLERQFWRHRRAGGRQLADRPMAQDRLPDSFPQLPDRYQLCSPRRLGPHPLVPVLGRPRSGVGQALLQGPRIPSAMIMAIDLHPIFGLL